MIQIWILKYLRSASKMYTAGAKCNTFTFQQAVPNVTLSVLLCLHLLLPVVDVILPWRLVWESMLGFGINLELTQNTLLIGTSAKVIMGPS